MTSPSSSELSLPYARFESAYAPVQVVRFTGEKPQEDTFAAYLDELAAMYEERRLFGLVFDATQASTTGIKYQRQQADWLRTYTPLIQQYCAGTAYIISNPLIRTVLKGIFSFQKQPAPYFITPHFDDGLGWARVQVLERLGNS